MKEKTKQILRYVACGLGGLALGIGLLGGLSMCASSGNNQAESVNTIYDSPKREQITTTEGGYEGYSFDVFSYGASVDVGTYSWVSYNVDISTYTLNVYREHREITLPDYELTTFQSTINSLISSETPTDANTYRFLLVEGLYESDNITRAFFYCTFLFTRSSGDGAKVLPFICTNRTYYNAYRLTEYGIAVYSGTSLSSNEYLINKETSDLIPFTTNQTTHPLLEDNFLYHFQDVESYYKELGYRNGHTAGYSEGYDDAYAEKDSGIAFTSCGVYPNAQVTLATDETIGNFKYMYLCHYITKPGYDEHTIYILWTTHATTGQYLGQVIDRNDSNSYSPAVTLGSFSEQPTSSVTITATQDMEFGLWVGYITTFHNRGEITNSILWFGGGTSESDLQIYQNGYDEGYQNGNQAGQQTGYDQGYERGQEVGDAEGYSRGYTEGFNQTNTKNVFSLFTSAFDSVSSFFDLKIFGFLPLYWFFLAPLFIALISLLMRMVKH